MARRHRILESEARYVMKVVHYRLEALVEEQGVGEEAQELFRVLWRFNRHMTGPPGYPEPITVDDIEGLLYATIHLRDVPREGQVE